jgi:hypothetical protein
MNVRPFPYPNADTVLPGVALFSALDRALAVVTTKVEFYFLGGAVLFQAFHSAPATARVTAMFRPGHTVRDAATRVAAGAGVSERWWVDAVKGGMQGDGTDYLVWNHVAVFAPVPAYVLAVKCAALGLEEGESALDDVRYVLRAMNIRSADEAMDTVQQYFVERQLPPGTRGTVEALVGS